MRIIKKDRWSALLLSSLLLTARSYADTVACGPVDSCAPCGYVTANVTNTPSDAKSVNPLMNFLASAETVRCRGYWSGPYVGAAWGLGNIKYQLEVGGSEIPTTLGAPSSGLDSDSRHYLVTIFNAGFNLVLDHFLLGAEVGYNYRSRINPISYYDLIDAVAAEAGPGLDPSGAAASVPCKIRLDINSQHAVTGDILPGFVYDRFAAYLRLGVEQANYTWNRRVCFPSIFLNNVSDNIAIIEGEDFVQSIKKSDTGYRLGAGFGIAASAHISLHLNYIHTFGGKITFVPDVTAIAANTPVLIVGDPPVTAVALTQLAANNVIEPERDEVTFGVRFRF